MSPVQYRQILGLSIWIVQEFGRTPLTHILVSAYGLYENCLKLRPILIMEKEQVDFFADKLESVLKAILEYKTQ